MWSTAEPSEEESAANSDSPRRSVFAPGALSGTSRGRRGRRASRPDGSRLAGVIQNFDGKPVANAKVVVVRHERGSGGQNTVTAGESAVTDAEGRYDLAYPKPGTALHVYADGYAPTVLNMMQSIDGRYRPWAW